MSVRILVGDCRQRLKELQDQSVHCAVTSPPYFGLRDYQVEGQMGLEPTPDEYVAGMVEVFREVRRVLRDDGTLWLNIGDSYSGSGKGGNPEAGKQATNKGSQSVGVLYGKTGETARQAEVTNVTRDVAGIPPKNLIGIPWMLAFALRAGFAACSHCKIEQRADLWPIHNGHRICIECLIAGHRDAKVISTEPGWFLRQDIIWSKSNPMPESVRDRCTKAHEYLFLLSKGPRYYYDAEAISEPVSLSTVARLAQDIEAQAGSDRVPGKTNGPMKAVGRAKKGYTAEAFEHPQSEPRGSKSNFGDFDTRNKRSVWEVATRPFSEAHFATYPPALIEPCILAGCPERCCAKCGAPYQSIIEATAPDGRKAILKDGRTGRDEEGNPLIGNNMTHPGEKGSFNAKRGVLKREVIGSGPSCDCEAGHIAGTVLDPFGGAGTTGLVADRLGRNAILIELNPEYAAIAERRLTADSPLFAQVAAA